jgi:histidine ammonia-lyase
MATHASRRVHTMARNAAYVVAIELLSAAQGVDLRGGEIADGTRAVYNQVRKAAAFLDEDRVLAGEMEDITALILQGGFAPFGRIDLQVLVNG